MKKLLRFASALLCGAMLLCSLSVTAFAEDGGDDEVYDFDPNTDKIYSEAVYMVNTDTGDVVYKKNENKKMYPASTTKIMTCIIALEHLSEGTLKRRSKYLTTASTISTRIRTTAIRQMPQSSLYRTT